MCSFQVFFTCGWWNCRCEIFKHGRLDKCCDDVMFSDDGSWLDVVICIQCVYKLDMILYPSYMQIHQFYFNSADTHIPHIKYQYSYPWKHSSRVHDHILRKYVLVFLVSIFSYDLLSNEYVSIRNSFIKWCLIPSFSMSVLIRILKLMNVFWCILIFDSICKINFP